MSAARTAEKKIWFFFAIGIIVNTIAICSACYLSQNKIPLPLLYILAFAYSIFIGICTLNFIGGTAVESFGARKEEIDAALEKDQLERTIYKDHGQCLKM